MYDYDKHLDKLAKELANKRRHHTPTTLGDRIKPEAKGQLLALRQQLATTK